MLPNENCSGCHRILYLPFRSWNCTGGCMQSRWQDYFRVYTSHGSKKQQNSAILVKNPPNADKSGTRNPCGVQQCSLCEREIRSRGDILHVLPLPAFMQTEGVRCTKCCNLLCTGCITDVGTCPHCGNQDRVWYEILP